MMMISLLLISSSYPIVLTKLGGPRSRCYTAREISRTEPGIEPMTSGMVDRHENHYTTEAVNYRHITDEMRAITVSLYI